MERLGIRFLNHAGETERGEEKFCAWAQMAREGKDVCVTEANISCPLARYNLGYSGYSSELAGILVGWGDAVDEEVAQTYLKGACRLQGTGAIRLCTELEDADIVVYFGTPVEIMEKVREYSSRTGKRVPGTASGIGAMCGELVAMPYMTGSPNISVGCGGSRKRVIREGEVAVAFPTLRTGRAVGS